MIKSEKSDMLQSLKSANLKLSFSISPITKWVLTILILGVGIIAAAYLYNQEQARNSQLQDQVDRAGADLVQNSLQRQDLSNKLAVANLALAEKKIQVPPSGQTMTVEEALCSAASEAGVELLTINCPEPQAETVNGVNYDVFNMTISLQGGPANLLYFTGHLGYWLPTSSMQSISLGENGMNVTAKVYALAG